LGEVFAQAEVASPANNGVRARLCALVDTGSSYTIIPPQLVRRLGLLVVDREELNTAKDETVPGRIVEASLRVGTGAWLHRHLVFASDEPLREDLFLDRATGRTVRPGALLGALTLQEAGLLVDFRRHRVRRAKRT